MTNEEYYIILSSKINLLKQLRVDCKDIVNAVIGQSLLEEDFFFFSSADRCMHLIDGFIAMLQERNLTCAGALLRLQLDNCMRTYAAFIAEDKEAVVGCIISGKRIDHQKSRDNKQLKDFYLKNELNKIDPYFSSVYDSTSGYIHFSDKAFYQTLVKCKDYIIEFEIGKNLSEKMNPTLIECADAFIHFINLYLKMLNAVAESKSRYDERYQD